MMSQPAAQTRERPLPHDIEAEKAILGQALLDQRSFASAAGLLTADDFFAEQNRFIFEAMAALCDRGEPVDEVTLRGELKSRDTLQRAGGPAYIGSLLDGLPALSGEAAAKHVRSWARKVRDCAARRCALEAARNLGRELLDPSSDLQDVLGKAQQLTAHLTSATVQADDPSAFETVDEGRYRLTLPALGIVLEGDYLRRESSQLKCELLVRCDLAGARTRDGVLAVSDLNLSSTRARQMHAKYLAERAKAGDLDWTGILEEFAQRVLAAERDGEPAVLLRDLPRPAPDETLAVDGLQLLARHPVILFGDGGAAKSYLALYVAGSLAQRGHRVGFFDWELAGEDHRDRLERLFGSDMPALHYARCSRPLVYEADRLRRIVRDDRLDYIVLDSVAFACDGPPEAAEVASRYFQALRQLGDVGSLHLAHITKALEGADRRPFGSTFWHNGARATWNVKLAAGGPEDDEITVGLYNRKANLGPLQSAVGFRFIFLPDETIVRRADLSDVDDLAASMSIPERLHAALKHGARTREQIAAELSDVKDSSLRSAISRAASRGQVVQFPGPNGEALIGLPDRRSR